MDRVVESLLFLLLTVVPVRQCIPQNGNYEGLNLTFTTDSPNSTTVCASLAMQEHQPIRITLDKVYMENGELNITVTSYLYYSDCATLDHTTQCPFLADTNHVVAYNTIKELSVSADPNFNYHFQNDFTTYTKSGGDDNKEGNKEDGDDNEEGNEEDGDTNGGENGNAGNTGNQRARSTDDGSGDPTTRTNQEEPTTVSSSVESSFSNTIVHYKNETFPVNWTTFNTPGTAVYIVLMEAGLAKEVDDKGLKSTNVTLTFHIEMKNSYGYLSLVDYPALIVFSILLVVYVFYAFLWLGMMACYFRDIVRLQFWVAAVIVLGFLEKVFFVSEYNTANQGQESWGLIFVAEGVSAAKRALSRMLIIVVCEGFGTVKPRLGSTLAKVVAVGVVYFVMAFIDGVVRATKVTADSHDLTSVLTFAMLILIDTGIVYWVFCALVDTRRTLRLRKNLVKLSVYNHLAYTLIFTCAASVLFVAWEIFEIATSDCTADWKELWLMDCYWHILFCIILFVIMMIWRPSANKLRFAYALVSNEADDEEEMEQGPNKNFETVKMRPVNRLGSRVTSTEAEEDLKWVEENLPTTAIDKALPLVLDTDEEVMTTSFEVSKMN